MACSFRLVCHILLFVYFFKLSIPFIGFLDKCHINTFKNLVVTLLIFVITISMFTRLTRQQSFRLIQNQGILQMIYSIFCSFSIIFQKEFFLTLSQMTNFRLFQTKRLQTTILNLMKMEESFQKGRKHCGNWEKEKLLVNSNFSFPTVFSKDLYCRHVKTRVCLGKG